MKQCNAYCHKVKGVKHCGCLIHCRRYFVNALPKEKKAHPSSVAVEAVRYFDRIYHEEGLLVNMTADERYKERLVKIKPLLDELFARLETVQVSGKSALAKAVRYALHEKPFFYTFLQNGNVPPDNNRAENAIRPFAIGRKNWLFSNTANGAKASAVLYSIAATAQANGVDTEQYLTELFSQPVGTISLRFGFGVEPVVFSVDMCYNMKNGIGNVQRTARTETENQKGGEIMKTKLYTNNIHQYLQCSDIIDFDNESVAQLADKLYSASNGETNFIRKAFEYVRDHISHSADIGADEVPCTASQVLKAGHGICFAKSHLLAAILRSRGIPAGFCYQKIVLNDDADVPELVYHGLNGVYLREHDKWIRLDARGNKEGVNAQFSIDTEQLAFPIRTDKGEQDDFTVYPVPDKEIIDVLTSNDSRAQLWAVLPMQLEYYNAIKTTESENKKI